MPKPELSKAPRPRKRRRNEYQIDGSDPADGQDLGESSSFAKRRRQEEEGIKPVRRLSPQDIVKQTNTEGDEEDEIEPVYVEPAEQNKPAEVPVYDEDEIQPVSKNVSHRQKRSRDKIVNSQIENDDDLIVPAHNVHARPSSSSRRRDTNQRNEHVEIESGARVIDGRGDSADSNDQARADNTLGVGGDDSDDGQDDDSDEESNQRLFESNGFSHCGVLQSVRLDRFMSHTCFSYDLCPNVNIVNGDNGSGKSAICAAIQMGLGARPSSTDRSKNIDGFIKHGEQNAVVTLKILNKKPDVGPDMTFKHDVYGDYIVVERRMMRGKNGKAGSNSWTIKGKKRSVKLHEGQTARREVMEMVDHFGFMVSNPVAVLNQESSKKFLAKGKPKEHYELYQEATLLAPLKKELECTIGVTEKVEKILSSRNSVQPEVMKQLSKLEAANRDAQEMKNIHHRIRNGACRLAWTKHQELDADLASKQKRTSEEFDPAVENATRRVNAISKKAHDIAADAELLTKGVEESNQKVSHLASVFRLAKQECQKVTLEINCTEQKIQTIGSEIAELDHNIRSSEADMERAENEHFKGQEQKLALGGTRSALVEKDKNLRSEITGLEQEQQTCGNEDYTLRDEVNRFREEVNRWDRDLEQKKREFAHIDQTIKNANQLTKFGHYVPLLQGKIHQHQHRFEVVPVGPIGMFVNVHDESWVPVIEEAVGARFLMSYIVNNYRDQKLMMSLLNDRGQRPQVLVMDMRNGRYQVDRRKVADVERYGHRTILDMVTVTNDTVFNALLDFVQMEQVVMHHGEEDITHFGWKEIPNMKIVWNKKGDRAFIRNGARLYRGFHGHPLTARFLTKDMRPYLNQLQDEVRYSEQQRYGAEQKRKDAMQKINTLRTRVSSVNMELTKLRAELNEVVHKKASIEDQLRRTDSDFDASPFIRTIEAYQTKKADYIQQKAASEEGLADKERKVAESKANSDDARRKLQEGKSELETASRKLEATQDILAQARSKLRHCKSELAAAQLKQQQAHSRLQEMRNGVAEAYGVAMASGTCPSDIDYKKESSATIEKLLTTWKKRLETEEGRRGGRSADEIEREYLLAKTKHVGNQKKLDRVRNYLGALEVGIEYREQKLRMLERTLKKMVRSNFRLFMGTRSHTGNIRFAVEGTRKELHITTEMASHDKGDGERYQTKDLRSLSGGERSFTTLCFMMALAEICSVPVRVMDEIDVFQDEANRRVSFKMLIDFFTKFLSHRQIILITPHALPNIDPSPQVRIVRLKKPRDDDSKMRQTQIDSFYE